MRFHDDYKLLYQALYEQGLEHPMLSLESDGAYYASKYEGFKVVSPEMALIFHPSDIPRPAEQSVYREELDSLTQHINMNMPADEFYARAYRFIAQQPSGVNLDDYITGLERHLKRTE